MTRTEAALRRGKTSGTPVVLPFVCGGYLGPGVTEQMLVSLGALGCPAIEVGIPFSDPIADGPVIAAAMHSALNPSVSNGIAPATPERIFEEVSRARSKTTAALVAMVSYSIVTRIGEGAFVRAAANAGFDGLIVPDLPLEESGSLRSLAAQAACSLSLLLAPTTPAVRATEIAHACSGFVYLLARTGVTGAASRADTPAGEKIGSKGTAETELDLATRVSALRRSTALPIACGFGISNREDVQRVLEHCDAAIVGSALVRTMGEAASAGHDPVEAGTRFVRGLMA